ncbi:alpha/beta hydrolase [Burkholderia pseudomultivorans]|nr:alpha/beta fold hydrolase [Burkholderia pseudomultivorans]
MSTPGYALMLDGAGVIVDNRTLCCRGVAVPPGPCRSARAPSDTTWMALLSRIATTMDFHSGSSLSAAVQAEIEAPGPTGSLKGTLLSPSAGDAPVVLIVPGSGATDRNGNGPAGGQPSTCRLLAEGLLGSGIASVRIDKRGMYGSASAIPDANDVAIDDYVADIHAWVAAIRARTGASRVWLLGHSEGGLVALLAARQMADVAGLILVATAGRPVGQVLRQQLQDNPANAPVLENAMSILASLESGERVDASRIHPALMQLFAPKVQRFLISELTIDPAALIADCLKPVLIVQGTRDIQVGIQDAERLKQANPRAEMALIADANHVLKTVRTSDRHENIAAYSNPDLPLAEGVVEVVAAFVWG